MEDKKISNYYKVKNQAVYMEAHHTQSKHTKEMENFLPWLCTILLPATAFLLLLLKQSQRAQGLKNRPPGPPGLPIFGNMFELGNFPHQTLYKLKPKYGPVLWLKLGSINTLVIQSAEAAEELFKNHDLSFCGRKCPGQLAVHNYNLGAMALGQYGSYWRLLRRLYSLELMSNKRINETIIVRSKCVDDMIKYIKDADGAAGRAQPGESGREVNLPHVLFLMAFNLIGNLVLSRDLLNLYSNECNEFYDAMNKVAQLAGKPNLSDFLPFLRFFDLQGIMKNMNQEMGRALKIIAGFVKDRIQELQSGRENSKGFLDVLLEYEEEGKEGPCKISDHNINIFVLEMFFAGTETTSSTIEWAMAELLRNPKSMKKAKEELNIVDGPKNKVEESDIDRLPYLQAVIKETMRLHPAAPLLVPRNTLQDTNFMGYPISKDTQVFVNAWGIGKDPDSWEDPLTFKPDRFLGSNIDYKGRNYELIPFGSGRRICAGMSLAHQIIHLALASLLHCFDWELGRGTTPETLDMNERMGMTVRKLVPL